MVAPPESVHVLPETALPRLRSCRGGRALTRDSLATREKSLWRYREVLPLPAAGNFFHWVKVGRHCSENREIRRRRGSYHDLWIRTKKAQIPTQRVSKARGMAVACPWLETPWRRLARSTAGNAGGTLTAYAVRAGLEAHVFMPRDTPRANIIECRELGANVVLPSDGVIYRYRCGDRAAEAAEGWFDKSTLKRNRSIESRGKRKRLATECRATRLGLARRHHYPTGGLPALSACGKLCIDRWKPLGWIGSTRHVHHYKPAAAPRSTRLRSGRGATAAEFPDAHTCFSGLRVPKAVGDFFSCSRILHESKGGGVGG